MSCSSQATFCAICCFREDLEKSTVLMRIVLALAAYKTLSSLQNIPLYNNPSEFTSHQRVILVVYQPMKVPTDRSLFFATCSPFADAAVFGTAAYLNALVIQFPTPLQYTQLTVTAALLRSPTLGVTDVCGTGVSNPWCYCLVCHFSSIVH